MITLPDIETIRKTFPDARQESDGSITFLCPVCEAEGRQTRARLYRSGTVACVRYASIGGDEAKAHHGAIRAELGVLVMFTAPL